MLSRTDRPENQPVKKTLTDRLLKSLKPAAPGKRPIIWDAVVPGFGIRNTDRGHLTFVLGARFPGTKHFTPRELGEYGALTLEQARDRAREWLDLIVKGVDPRAHSDDLKLVEQRRRENSFEAVANEFIRLNVIGPDPAKPKQRKGREVERDVRREFIARWGKRPITAITAHDVIAVLDDAVARGSPYQAHNLLGYVRRIFNWAIARGVYGIDRSPVDRMRPGDVIGKKALRTRVLTDAELHALWQGTGRMAYPYGPLFRMLALTGQRKSEVAEARWGEFDIRGALWQIPRGRMKGDAPHIVPLTPEATAILESLPRFDRGDFLFSATFGEQPVNGFSKSKARLDQLMLAELRKGADDPKKITLDEWVIHDIRRTVRTRLSALPIPDLVRELVIAHAQRGLHKVYDQHSYINEKRRALELWTDRLLRIVEPRSLIGNVVTFAQAHP
jgi:integrase